MTHFSTHFYFGTIIKPVGLKGEVVVKNLSDKWDNAKAISLIFLDINKQLTPFFAEKISFRKKGEAVLKIGDINSIEQTKDFLKKDIFLTNDLLVKKQEGFIEFKDLIGFLVNDKTYGDIGTIRTILTYPQQEIFEIIFKGKEILIPANEDFIEKINVKAKTIHINAPAGLIDLYLTNNTSKEEEE